MPGDGHMVVHGEPVGIVAAQSLGEPITQMLLLSIHNAGLESGLASTGLDRITEILEGRKRPSRVVTIIYPLPEIEKDREKVTAVMENVCKAVGYVNTGRFRQIGVVERLAKGEKAGEYIKAGEYYITAVGCIVGKIRGIAGIDHPKTYTNDINGICEAFGIEAARDAIVTELGKTFSEHGIQIGQNHLYLIADAMTSSGRIVPLSRIIKEKQSPIAKAIFANGKEELINAAGHGETDALSGVSERIAVGLPMPHGTGAVKLRIDGDDFAGKNESMWKLPFEEREIGAGYLQTAKNIPMVEGREREPTAYEHANRALGSILTRRKPAKRIRDRKFRKAMMRHLKRSRFHYADDSERRLDYALPLFGAYWGMINSMHKSIRRRSAWLYRECIRKDITRGRALKEMVPACIIMAYAMDGIVRDDLEVFATGSDLYDEIPELELGMGARPGRVYSNCRRINRELGLGIWGFR